MEVVEQEQILDTQREEEIEVEEEASGTADVADESRRLDSIVESVLFAAGTPLPLRRMIEILGGPTAKEVKASVERLRVEYEQRRGGIQLAAVAGGFQFRTVPENAEWVRALLRERPARLGRAALETLSIIAYKQPATRAEIEAIRGVDADSAIGTLLAKRLIKIAGRKEAVGRPLMYSTTDEFLEIFGLKDVNELPALKEIGPVAEPEDEASEEDDDTRGAFAENPEPRGDQLATDGGGDDPRRTGGGEWPRGEGAGDEGGPDTGPDHG
jgi:segregation and condensation protein B